VDRSGKRQPTSTAGAKAKGRSANVCRIGVPPIGPARSDTPAGWTYTGGEHRFSGVVGVLRIELHIPSARSLKEKRATLRPILDTARNRYRVAIAETGYQDLHQRATFEAAAVASAAHVVTEMLDAVERLAWSAPAAEVVSAGRYWLDDDQ
jgi:uncharacterized protein YlxP (DUF503 family)